MVASGKLPKLRRDGWHCVANQRGRTCPIHEGTQSAGVVNVMTPAARAQNVAEGGKQEGGEALNHIDVADIRRVSGKQRWQRWRRSAPRSEGPLRGPESDSYLCGAFAVAEGHNLW